MWPGLGQSLKAATPSRPPTGVVRAHALDLPSAASQDTLARSRLKLEWLGLTSVLSNTRVEHPKQQLNSLHLYFMFKATLSSKHQWATRCKA